MRAVLALALAAPATGLKQITGVEISARRAR